MKNTIFSIHGRVISKKNSKQWIRRGNKNFLVPSDAYESFRASALEQIIKELKIAPKFSGKLYINITFYIKGGNHIDIDNALTSIFDILQDKQFPVIVDDDQVVRIDCTKILSASDWITHIQISDYTEGGET